MLADADSWPMMSISRVESSLRRLAGSYDGRASAASHAQQGTGYRRVVLILSNELKQFGGRGRGSSLQGLFCERRVRDVKRRLNLCRTMHRENRRAGLRQVDRMNPV